MKEDLLHFVWKYKKYPNAGLRTTSGNTVLIKSAGVHNKLSGPDFFNVSVEIDGQLWAGNVEIHIKSSDWYAHNHEKDANYNNVILHVVWEDDISVFRADGSEIPTLELRNYIPNELLVNYKRLLEGTRNRTINCQYGIHAVSDFTIHNWLERLYFERLEKKSLVISKLLKDSKNEWEKVLFILLFKNFGSKINGTHFFEIAENLNFSIVRKLYNKPLELESLLFGLAGLLTKENEMEPYQKELKQSFDFLVHKYELSAEISKKAEFFKLRPLNFPTIRISQFAALYASNNQLFQDLMQLEGRDLYELFNVKASIYWDTHYTFGKTSNNRVKKISKKFIDLLIINTVMPLKFCYQKHNGIPLSDSFTKSIERIDKEGNSIVQIFLDLGVTVKSAKDTQALLELYNNYCEKNNCLQCAVGTELLTLKH